VLENAELLTDTHAKAGVHFSLSLNMASAIM
jgi:hypothetical protein